MLFHNFLFSHPTAFAGLLRMDQIIYWSISAKFSILLYQEIMQSTISLPLSSSLKQCSMTGSFFILFLFPSNFSPFTSFLPLNTSCLQSNPSCFLRPKPGFCWISFWHILALSFLDSKFSITWKQIIDSTKWSGSFKIKSPVFQVRNYQAYALKNFSIEFYW